MGTLFSVFLVFFLSFSFLFLFLFALKILKKEKRDNTFSNNKKQHQTGKRQSSNILHTQTSTSILNMITR